MAFSTYTHLFQLSYQWWKHLSNLVFGTAKRYSFALCLIVSISSLFPLKVFLRLGNKDSHKEPYVVSIINMIKSRKMRWAGPVA
jgi:hypothetical protein